MLSMERTFVVDRPLELVQVYLADFGNAEEWDPGTKSCARLDSGPIEVGARWRNVSQLRVRETELEYELTRADPDRLTFVGRNKTVTSTDDIRLTRLGRATEITYSAHFDFHGLARLAQLFLRSTFHRIADDTEALMRATLTHV